MSHTCQRFWDCSKTFTFCLLLARCRIPCACYATPHLNLQKWSEHVVFLAFCWKCASGHNGVHFFDISTSKSGPTMVCFAHFDFDMCFAPRRLFDISTSKSAPTLVRFLCILTWKCDSRHNSVHLFDISTSKSAPTLVRFVHVDFEMCFTHLHATTECIFSSLRTRRFGEPTFRPSRATDHFIAKTQWIATFLLFRAPASSFFWLFLFSDLLFSSLLWLFPPLLFHLSILSKVWLQKTLRWLWCYWRIYPVNHGLSSQFILRCPGPNPSQRRSAHRFSRSWRSLEPNHPWIRLNRLGRTTWDGTISFLSFQ